MKAVEVHKAGRQENPKAQDEVVGTRHHEFMFMLVNEKHFIISVYELNNEKSEYF